MTKRTRALILLGHGSEHGKESSLPVRQQAELLKHQGIFDEVLAAFWKEAPYIRDAVDLVKSDDVFVVPYFMSNGYYTEQIIPRELKIQGKFTKRGERRIFYGEPIGTHPSMVKAICHAAKQLLETGPGPKPKLEEATLILVGHGTTQNEHSGDSLFQQVQCLKEKGMFKEVLPAFMEQSPRDCDVLALVKTSYAVVIPFFISDGFHSREEVPTHMGLMKKGESLNSPVHFQNSIWVWYGRSVGMEPQMTNVILDRVRDLEKDI